MAPDRTVSGHRITRPATAHRVLRSELDDYYFKFKVSLPQMLTLSPERRPGAAPRISERPYGRSLVP